MLTSPLAGEVGLGVLNAGPGEGSAVAPEAPSPGPRSARLSTSPARGEVKQ